MIYYYAWNIVIDDIPQLQLSQRVDPEQKPQA